MLLETCMRACAESIIRNQLARVHEISLLDSSTSPRNDIVALFRTHYFAFATSNITN